MSFILDALKKSEQERTSQQAPGLNTARIEKKPEHPSKPLWIWLIPLLLGLNIILLLLPGKQNSQEIKVTSTDSVTLMDRQPTEPESQKAALEKHQQQDDQPVEVASVNGQVALSPSKQSPSVPAPSTLSPSKEAASLPAESIIYHRDPFAPLQSHNPKAIQIAAPVTKTTATPVTKEKRPPRTLPTPDLALLNQSLINQALIEKLAPLQEEQPPDNPTLNTRPTAEPLAQPPEQQPPVKQSIANQSLAKQTEQIPQFLELSEKLRKEIAPLNISVHIYTAEAADRMARINGRMVHEGHSFSEQLRLLEITPDALIFSYKGQRFQIKR